MSQPIAVDVPKQQEAIAHPVPARVLLSVIAALLVLTAITVAATWVDLGAWNLWIALGIATLKAALVALYFMHLRYDNPFNALAFVTALVFLLLLLSLTMLDTFQYQPDISNW
jgi:cytochrome c oxidase subunit 4